MSSLLDSPPRVALRKVRAENDMRSLRNAHRILHAWWDELLSPSHTRRIGQHAWKPKDVAAVHEAVVGRMMALRPDTDHNTPLVSGLKVPPLSPIMLQRGAVVATGWDGGRLRAGLMCEVDAAAADELKTQLGDGAAVVRGAGGTHVVKESRAESAQRVPLYHLVLLPAAMWHAAEEPTLHSAMESYEEELGPLLREKYFRSRILQGSAIIRSRLPGCADGEEARSLGREIARWATSDLPMPDDYKDRFGRLAAAQQVNLSRIQQQAREIFDSVTVGVEEKARKKGRARLRVWVEENIAGHDLRPGVALHLARHYAATLGAEVSDGARN